MRTGAEKVCMLKFCMMEICSWGGISAICLITSARLLICFVIVQHVFFPAKTRLKISLEWDLVSFCSL